MIGYILFAETLSEVSFAESDVDDAAANPGDESRCIGEVHEPTKDDRAAVGAI